MFAEGDAHGPLSGTIGNTARQGAVEQKMNWEAKLEEARRRRAAVLAARKAAEESKSVEEGETPETPPDTKSTSKARVVDMSKAMPVVDADGDEALPPLVLDDAYQVRNPHAPEEIVDPETDYPPDLREKKPVFRTARTDLPIVAAKGVTGLAVAGIVIGVLFHEAASNPAEDPRRAAVALAAATAEVKSVTQSVSKSEAATQITLADAIKPELGLDVLVPEAMPEPIVPYGTGLALPVKTTEEPVLLASLETAALILPRPGNAPEAIMTETVRPDLKRIRVIVPETVPSDVREAVVARIEGVPKAELDGVAAVDYRISATHVRYYHSEDRDAAETFADGIGAVARDFTDYKTPETAGYLEVYLKGGAAAVDEVVDPAPEPQAVVEAVASEPNDDISRVLDEILKN